MDVFHRMHLLWAGIYYDVIEVHYVKLAIPYFDLKKWWKDLVRLRARWVLQRSIDLLGVMPAETIQVKNWSWRRMRTESSATGQCHWGQLVTLNYGWEYTTLKVKVKRGLKLLTIAGMDRVKQVKTGLGMKLTEMKQMWTVDAMQNLTVNQVFTWTLFSHHTEADTWSSTTRRTSTWRSSQRTFDLPSYPGGWDAGCLPRSRCWLDTLLQLWEGNKDDRVLQCEVGGVRVPQRPGGVREHPTWDWKAWRSTSFGWWCEAKRDGKPISWSMT